MRTRAQVADRHADAPDGYVTMTHYRDAANRFTLSACLVALGVTLAFGGFANAMAAMKVTVPASAAEPGRVAFVLDVSGGQFWGGEILAGVGITLAAIGRTSWRGWL